MKNKGPSTGLIVLLAIFLGMMVTGTIILQCSKSTRLQERTKITELLLTQNKGAAEIEKTKHQRAAFFTKHLLLNHPSRLSFAVADFVRDLSVVSTNQFHWQKLHIRSGVGSLSFRLSGMIVGVNREEAEKAFSEFDEKLRGLEKLIDASSDGIRDGGDQNGEKCFVFEITGEAGLE